jgi:hypothetical protein
MKEFEQWVRENWTDLKEINPYPYRNLLGAGWKAALEWIYREAKKLEAQPESPIDAFDLIEEELEE